jgi:hypothetical protein
MNAMTLLPIHIAAAAIGIVSGFVALFAVKGAKLHRTSGMVFVYSMLAMALVGALIAAVRDVVPQLNTSVGLLTAYLVVTALTTIRPPAGSPRVDLALLLLALAVTAAFFVFGGQALTSAAGTLRGIPAAPFFVFGSIGLLATAGDVRLVRSGGVRAIRGTPRLVRHLWRMSSALLIAAFSFFIGQAKVIPKPVRIIPLLAIPPAMVLIVLFYWVWRVQSTRSSRAMVTSAARGNLTTATQAARVGALQALRTE